MTERQFTIALTDAERLMVLTALGFVSMRVPPASHPWTVIDGLIAKVTHASVANERTPAGGESRTEFEHDRFGTAGPISGTGTARAVLAPPTPKDYFQPTKSGKAVTEAPEGAELSQVKISSVQKLKLDAKYWTVTFTHGEPQTAGRASCWDAVLAEKLRGVSSAWVWIQESGNYLNIVGVRA